MAEYVNPENLSQIEKDRALKDALNVYIAKYGAGSSAGGVDEFSKTQNAMFLPYQLQGKVIALKIEYPEEFLRLLRKEVKEEVVENKDEINRALYEQKKKDEELEQQQRLLANTSHKSSDDMVIQAEAERLERERMEAERRRDILLISLGLGGHMLAEAEVKKMKLNVVDVNDMNMETSKIRLLFPENKKEVSQEMSPERRITYLKLLEKCGHKLPKGVKEEIVSAEKGRVPTPNEKGIWGIKNQQKPKQVEGENNNTVGNNNNVKVASGNKTTEMSKPVRDFLLAKRSKERNEGGRRSS